MYIKKEGNNLMLPSLLKKPILVVTEAATDRRPRQWRGIHLPA